MKKSIMSFAPKGCLRQNAGGLSVTFRSQTLRIEHGIRSDRGMVRASNEDSYIANGKSGIFLVADGMGGHAAGEIASQITASTVEKILAEGAPGSDMEDLLKFAVEKANTNVYETQKLKPECRGMGSTLTVLAVSNSHYYVAQVGDSRAYLMRDGMLSQLTQDHSLVWPLFKSGIISKDDISRHPQKNLITRSIGTQPQVEVDSQAAKLLEGDVFLLCSDGLTDVLTDGEISDLLTSRNRTPQELSSLLVDAANAGGGPDNITAIVISISRL